MESRELLSHVAVSEFVFIVTCFSDQLNAVRTVNLITLYVCLSVHSSLEKKKKKRTMHVLSVRV